MEQDVRFCELDGRRIAYATVGEGPLLLFGGRWVSHLEEEWDDPLARSFFEELARSHRVVRYDRLGAGLSDRALPSTPTPEAETAQLEAVHEACGGEPATLFACSCAGLATARFASASPERVRKVVFFGGYASRDDIPEATRRSLVDFVRVNWQLAAQMLAGLFLPRGGGDEISALSRYQRHSADADVAAAFLELDLASDARAFLPSVSMPAVVLHRRGDRTVPIGRGRELASLLPNARFVTLAGDSHLPWADDQRELQRALAGFLDDA
ncbi:MAG: alpha/beta fold hydrolase, partial [Gaiellaceae bacterium]